MAPYSKEVRQSVASSRRSPWLSVATRNHPATVQRRTTPTSARQAGCSMAVDAQPMAPSRCCRGQPYMALCARRRCRQDGALSAFSAARAWRQHPSTPFGYVPFYSHSALDPSLHHQMTRRHRRQPRCAHPITTASIVPTGLSGNFFW